MKKGILATVMMTAALAMGFSGERMMIKRDNTISRNWKEDQDKEEKQHVECRYIEKNGIKVIVVDGILIRFNFAEEVNNNILLKIYEDGESVINIKKESSVYGDILEILKEKRILR